jgi:hypothetical protein
VIAGPRAVPAGGVAAGHLGGVSGGVTGAHQALAERAAVVRAVNTDGAAGGAGPRARW